MKEVDPVAKAMYHDVFLAVHNRAINFESAECAILTAHAAAEHAAEKYLLWLRGKELGL